MADHPLPTAVDTAVIGAGVWGLTAAWRLAAAGATVALVDDGGEPTAAVAAGMLCPWSEHEDDGERDFYTALRFAAAAWPTFAAEVEAAAGLPSGFHRCGSVYVAARPEHLGAVRRVRDTLARNGRPEDWQDADALTAVEPGLGPAVTGGIALDDEHQADPAVLVTALHATGRAAGVLFVDGTAEIVPGGVRVGGATIAAGVVVNAAGHAAGRLSPRVPVRPVKGQILTLAPRPRASVAAAADGAHTVLLPGAAARRPRGGGRDAGGAHRPRRHGGGRVRPAGGRAADRTGARRTACSQRRRPGCVPPPPICGPPSASTTTAWSGRRAASATACCCCRSRATRSPPRRAAASCPSRRAASIRGGSRERAAERPHGRAGRGRDGARRRRGRRCRRGRTRHRRGAGRHGRPRARPGTRRRSTRTRSSRCCARRPEADMHDDPFIIAGTEIRSRLLLGSGGFHRLDRFEAALAASGAEIVTVALRRVEQAPGGLYDAISAAAPACCRTPPAASPPARPSPPRSWRARRSRRPG